jgi:hypothetical protein
VTDAEEISEFLKTADDEPAEPSAPITYKTVVEPF